MTSDAEFDSDRVTIDEYEPNHVVMTANVENRAMVILNDSYAPGWNASVNGKPAPIYRVNGLARGIYVDSGESRIVFKYEPRGFSLGIIVALISIALSLGWFAAARHSEKTSKTQDSR